MIWEQNPAVSSPWFRFLLAQESPQGLHSKRQSGRVAPPAILILLGVFSFTAWCSVTQMHPNERAGAVGWPRWSPTCPSSLEQLPPLHVAGSYLASPGSQCRKWAWAWLPVVAGPPLVTLLGKACGISDWPPTQALPWRATLWGLRAIPASTGDAFHSATWRNSCPISSEHVRPGQDEAEPLAP